MDLGRKWLVGYNAGKSQLDSFDTCNNTGAIDIKMNGSALEVKSSFKMLGLTFSSKLDWGSYIISIAKNLKQMSSTSSDARFFCFTTNILDNVYLSINRQAGRHPVVFIYLCFLNQGKDLAQNQDPHHIEDPEDPNQGQLTEVHPSRFLLCKTLLLKVSYKTDSFWVSHQLHYVNIFILLS